MVIKIISLQSVSENKMKIQVQHKQKKGVKIYYRQAKQLMVKHGGMNSDLQ